MQFFFPWWTLMCQPVLVLSHSTHSIWATAPPGITYSGVTNPHWSKWSPTTTTQTRDQMLAPQAQVKSTHKFIHIPFTVWVGFRWWLYSHAKTWSRFYTLVHSNHWSYLVVRNLRHNSHTKYFRDFVLWYKQHTLITIRAVDHWERRHVYLRGENICFMKFIPRGEPTSEV